jgi:hypothetical protein
MADLAARSDFQRVHRADAQRPLKEFQGGLELRSEGFGTIAVVVDPTMPGNVAHVAAFNAREVRDRLGRPVLPNFHSAIAFWDRCLSQAETAFGEAPTLRS